MIERRQRLVVVRVVDDLDPQCRAVVGDDGRELGRKTRLDLIGAADRKCQDRGLLEPGANAPYREPCQDDRRNHKQPRLGTIAHPRHVRLVKLRE